MTSKTLSLAVSDRGDVRLPRAYRRRYRVGRGERLRVVDVGGLLILLPPTGRLGLNATGTARGTARR